MSSPECSTSAKHGCGETQVYSILKRKANYMKGVLLSCLKGIGSLNLVRLDWYLIADSKNIYPDGPTLSEIAKQLQMDGFKALNGWLQKWNTSHSITRIC